MRWAWRVGRPATCAEDLNEPISGQFPLAAEALAKARNWLPQNIFRSMSRRYRILDPEGLYFVSFATVGWVDLFTRRTYRDIVVDSLRYCQAEKGLLLFEWVIMTSHVHLMIKAGGDADLSGVVRDLKKYTSRQLVKAIEQHPQESRREWLLKMFREAGERNSNNTTYQVWQQHNKPLLLERTEEVERVADYIRQNPVMEGFVANAEDYLYSSAHDARLLRLEEA